LNCEEEEEEEEERASSLQVCGWQKGRRLGERKSSSNAKLGHCSVYIKPALLRRRLSPFLPSCPCLFRAARMDQDQSAFLVITDSQGWIDGWMNSSCWTRSTLFHWGFFIWSQSFGIN
jgi:hypothetical protein